MRILIVEDESVAARGLERMLRRLYGKTLQSIRIEKTLFTAGIYLEDHPVELVILDLNLNGEDGFQILQEAAAGSFQTVVVSAATERAIEAFAFGVLDFVPKPVNEERLKTALDRFISKESFRRKDTKFLSIRKEDRTGLIPVERILYIQADDNQARIFTEDGEVETSRKTLDSLETILPPDFFRVHRSYLAPLGRIQEVISEGGGKYFARLRNGPRIPVSRKRYRNLQEQIG